jgi:hypothetical protein
MGQAIIESAPSILRGTLDQLHGEWSHAVSMVDARNSGASSGSKQGPELDTKLIGGQ